MSMEGTESSSVSDDEHVILVCTDPDPIETDTGNGEILVSTRDILTWDFPTILNFQTIKVQAHRNRLIEQSSYFRGLLGGSFSESCLSSTFIKWNVRSFMYILKHIYDCPLNITSDTFLPLYEGALYFGVETLLLKCKTWFSEVSSSKGFQSTQLETDDLIEIWKFGLEHASDFILELCVSYLARNFMWAMHSKAFKKIPQDMLLSSIEHPQLTVDSEMHLSDALLLWLESNTENLESLSKAEDSCNGILKQIHFGLLPLWYAAGKRNSSHFREIAEASLNSIFKQLSIPPTGPKNILGYNDLRHLRIRLTEYSKKVDLSGCLQMTSSILLLSLIHSSYLVNPALRKIVEQILINSDFPTSDESALPQRSLQTLSFEAVQELDISKCQRLHIEEAVKLFCKSFPSLRTLKAAYLLNIGTANFLQLVQKCPLISEIDLTVDITPLIPAMVSDVSSSPTMTPRTSQNTSSVKNKALNVTSICESAPPLSNITKLALEGRTDVCDLDLHYISVFCFSLHHLNLKGCISVTDIAISNLIRRCRKLNSIVVCDTSFGINSVQALSYTISDSGDFSSLHFREKHINSLASNLQTLHMGGCWCMSEPLQLELMSQTQVLKSLCLRGTDLDDHALYNFSGSSLEMLDVSNTKISGAALAHVVRKNPNLKCLRARGCRNLFQEESHTERRGLSFSYFNDKLYAELGKMYRLEEIEFGWGFSSFSFKALEPALASLRTLNLGLGGMIGEDALRQLPVFCPLLETVILHFQVISDIILMNIFTNLKNLRVLALCYCFGDISISCFKFSMQNLRKLRLERVTPWITNSDLVILTQNCRNLVELSLLGCPLLNSDSQQIISCGWPGLASIHLELFTILEFELLSFYAMILEFQYMRLQFQKQLPLLLSCASLDNYEEKMANSDCGEVTASGVDSLLDCKAIEDLLLRHNGPGLCRDFIFYAASKMPLLRKLSLDICDASEGDFDIPKYEDRYFLSTLKIARCKYQRCAFNLPVMGCRSRSVHVETLVLVWDSRNLTRTVVKERL